jgi:hypothetical protein
MWIMLLRVPRSVIFSTSPVTHLTCVTFISCALVATAVCSHIFHGVWFSSITVRYCISCTCYTCYFGEGHFYAYKNSFAVRFLIHFVLFFSCRRCVMSSTSLYFKRWSERKTPTVFVSLSSYRHNWERILITNPRFSISPIVVIHLGGLFHLFESFLWAWCPKTLLMT